jgi:hypothetical protein
MFRYWSNLAMLALESQQVIGLRMMKLATGGSGAHAEAHRMVSEKVTEANNAAMSLMMGGSADSVVRNYRRKVRANVRRLTK